MNCYNFIDGVVWSESCMLGSSTLWSMSIMSNMDLYRKDLVHVYSNSNLLCRKDRKHVFFFHNKIRLSLSESVHVCQVYVFICV